MKLAVRARATDALRALARAEAAIAASAVDAAAEALVREAERAREAAGVAGKIERDGTARRRLIGSRDPAAVARELGTLDRPPAPWLAPVLPAARARMRREANHAGGSRAGVRAAASTAAARALSRLRKR